jgi:hypothetical protein
MIEYLDVAHDRPNFVVYTSDKGPDGKNRLECKGQSARLSTLLQVARYIDKYGGNVVWSAPNDIYQDLAKELNSIMHPA